MSTALGFVGLIVYIACVISLAAAVTWLTVKLLPARDTPKPDETKTAA